MCAASPRPCRTVLAQAWAGSGLPEAVAMVGAAVVGVGVAAEVGAAGLRAEGARGGPASWPSAKLTHQMSATQSARVSVCVCVGSCRGLSADWGVAGLAGGGLSGVAGVRVCRMRHRH